MAEVVTVKVEGLKELEEALKELPKATAKNTIRRSLLKASIPIVQTASILIKVKRIDDPVRVSKIKFTSGTTGAAGKAAFAEAMKRGASREEAGEAAHAANAAAAATGDNDASVTSGVMTIGPTRRAFYGFEFGTKYIAPKPFMRPAWDAHKMQALNTITDELKDQIEKARKRLAAKAARIAAKIK